MLLYVITLTEKLYKIQINQMVIIINQSNLLNVLLSLYDDRSKLNELSSKIKNETTFSETYQSEKYFEFIQQNS